MCRQADRIACSALAQTLARAAAVPFPKWPGLAGKAMGEAETHRRDGLLHICLFKVVMVLGLTARTIPKVPFFPKVRRNSGGDPRRMSSPPAARSHSPMARRTESLTAPSEDSGMETAKPSRRPSACSKPT